MQAGAIPLPVGPDGEDSQDEAGSLSEDDYNLLNDYAHGIDFLSSLPRKKLDKEVSEVKAQKEKKRSAREAYHVESDEAEEGAQDWEHTRGTSINADSDRAPVLPIKSIEGDIVQKSLVTRDHEVILAKTVLPNVVGITIQDDFEEELHLKKKMKREADQIALESLEKRRLKGVEQSRAKKDSVIAELASYASIEVRREEAKQRIALAAQALLAAPESALSTHLKPLLELSRDQDQVVARLALLSTLTVYKDILPGYRIRLPTEKELEVQVSKGIKKLRDYESALLKSYQAFLKILLQAINLSKAGQAPPQHGRVAIRCLCGLLTAVPHFNYTTDILQVIIPNCAAKDEKTKSMCVETLRDLLANEKTEGRVIKETVQLIADMVKKRKCICPEHILDPLLGLQFKDILSVEDFKAAKGLGKQNKKNKKKKKKKKGKDEVAKAFEEAEAVVGNEERKRVQSATLEALFEIFFRVLKATASSGLIVGPQANSTLTTDRLRSKFPLLYATLQGLEQYAHLISVDFFSDLMSELEKVLASPALPPRERLRCLLTVAQILRGQGEALTVDRRFFFVQLYAALDAVCIETLDDDEDFDDKEEEIPGTSASPPGIGQLLCRALEIMILESKSLDVPRQAAFARRIAGCALSNGDAGTVLGLLSLIQRLMRKHPKLRGMLLNEGEGGPVAGGYAVDAEDPADSGALNLPFWELSLLAQHYHPHVHKAALAIASNANTIDSVLPLGFTPSQIAAHYTTAQGTFRPGPKKVPQGSSGNDTRRRAANLLKERNGSLLLDDGEASVPDSGVLEGVLRRHYRSATKYNHNGELRKEKSILLRKLHLFTHHLQ